MPYVITTTNPRLRAAFEEAGGRGVDLAERIDAAESVRAVATREEAQEAVYAAVRDYAVPLKSHLKAEGGTVGPLPDGTVIEVRQINGYTLAGMAANLAGEPCRVFDAVGTFNAAQG